MYFSRVATELERIKLKAWDYALHAEGTRAVFDRRARTLRRNIRLRDFTGFAVPILVGYLAGSEPFELLKPYRSLAIGLLGIAALVQFLVLLWSVISRWDEELAYDLRATRDSYELREAWRKMAGTHSYVRQSLRPHASRQNFRNFAMQEAGGVGFGRG
jgi:mobilome CxxCx(11)CxxC protein